jgi:DNA-binding beta-propeller fold protein YncE
VIQRALFALVVAATAVTVSTPVGSLHVVPGRAGCISPADVPSRCRHARELRSGTVISPDGRTVYTFGGIDARSAIAVLRRNGRTGALEQLRGRAGCVHQSGRNCTAGPLNKPAALVVTADGREVVWANPPSPNYLLIAYRRARSTGALSALPCGSRCVAGTRGLSSCARALATSPDGRNLYATCSRGLAVYARDAATGRIRQLTGEHGCFHQFLLEDCANPRVAPFTPASVVVSNDGSNVYVLSSGGDAVYAFDRHSATGALTPAACYGNRTSPYPTRCRPLFGLETAYALDLSRDGRNAYLVGGLSANKGALTVLSRAKDGSLTSVGSVDVGPYGSVTVAPDGRSVYVANENGVDAFARARDGKLSRLPGSFGRIRLHPTNAFAAPMILSPDSRYAYLATGYGPDGKPERIIVLRRTRH